MNRDLPPAARAVAARVNAAVRAAASTDAGELRSAAAELEALDTGHVSTLLGAVIRMLLEEQHPDGVDGDDLRAVLDGCTRWAYGWQPADPEVLLVIVAGALGVHPEEADGISRPGPASIAIHAPLLVAYLLGPRKLDPYLSAAYAEIARAEIMD